MKGAKTVLHVELALLVELEDGVGRVICIVDGAAVAVVRHVGVAELVEDNLLVVRADQVAVAGLWEKGVDIPLFSTSYVVSFGVADDVGIAELVEDSLLVVREDHVVDVPLVVCEDQVADAVLWGVCLNPKLGCMHSA